MKIHRSNKYLMKILGFLVACSFLSPVMAEEVSDYSIAKGGRLYDKWFKENKTGMPKIPNPAYPAEGKYKGNKGADWRCKECHGWDYRGKEGAYRSGKHFTGTVGIVKASELSTEAIIKILRDKTHGYQEAMLSNDDANHLANFVKYGQVDLSGVVDSKTKEITGDETKGKNTYETACAVCHGLDGKSEDTPPLGKLSNDNPWEVMHKIMNGQPNNEMPALRALDKQISIDIISYMQKKLPKE